MESFTSNTVNSPRAILCNQSDNASNRTIDSFLDSSSNYDDLNGFAQQVVQIQLFEHSREYDPFPKNDSTTNETKTDIHSSTSSLSANSVFEEPSILNSIVNMSSVTIPETESEAGSEMGENSVFVISDSDESPVKFSPRAPRETNYEQVLTPKYSNQEFKLRGSVEDAVVSSVSIVCDDASIEIKSADTGGVVTNPHARNADVADEGFDSFYRNIATTINQDSTPLPPARCDTIPNESGQTQNASADASDVTSESNSSSRVITRASRVVRHQRKQLNYDSDANTDTDTDYVPGRAKSNARARYAQYGQFKIIAPNALVYLDLSKDLIAQYALEPADGKLVDNDEDFKRRLQRYLNGAQRSRRMLFTPSYIEDDHVGNSHHTDNLPAPSSAAAAAAAADIAMQTSSQLTTLDTIRSNAADPAAVVKLSPLKQPRSSLPVFLTLHKNLQAINVNAFSVTKLKQAVEEINATSCTIPTSRSHCERHKYVLEYLVQHEHKYDFIKSLDANTPQYMLHPMALFHISDFASPKRKKQFAVILYDLYNHKVFNCALDARIVWNRKVKRASFCCNTVHESHGRQAIIELSETRVDSAKCLSNILMHEMCHAAAWLFNGEHGHGNYCIQWLSRAKQMLPDLAISVNDCGRPPHVYTYTCTLCAASSQGSLLLKALTTAERLRCSYCLGAIAIETYRQASHQLPSVVHPTPFNAKQAASSTGFGRFVKANYLRVANDGHGTTTTKTHTTIMSILSDQYARGDGNDE